MRQSAGLAVAAGAVVLAGAVLTIGAADAAEPPATGSAAGSTVAGSTAAAAAVACPPGQEGRNPLPAAEVRAVEVVSGFAFLEGPVWDAASKTLFMSNLRPPAGAEQVQPSSILAFTGSARVPTFVANSGSNGLALSADGRSILAATHDERSISSYALPGGARTFVQRGQFNSPNDLTVRADGTVYFTDPSFQRGQRGGEPGDKKSVFRISGGQVRLVDDTIEQPNGIVLSPDGRTLYVAANTENAIFAYPVAADGSTGARQLFARMGTPDGATVDCAGNIYWASSREGLVHVFTPAGRELGRIVAGRSTTNAAFGGDDGRTLFLTSGVTGDFGLFTVVLNLPGSPY